MCYCIEYTQENLKIIFLLFSNLLFVYRFTTQEIEEKMLQQTTGKRSPLRVKKEAHYVGYCELGDFSQSSTTYYNLDYLKK